MSSLAGPSSLSHTLPAIPARPSQPTPIATKLRRTQDGPDSPAFASPAPVPPSAAAPGTPLLGGSSYAPTAYGTAPATPVARSSSVATTEVRETSLGPPANGHAGPAPNGTVQRRMSIDPKLALVPDLAAVYARANAQSRKRGRGSDEEEAMAQTAARIATRLVEDQRIALFPDTETPFEDEVDVVKRLLPFHVFQQPREDLDAITCNAHIFPSRKGKRKATEEDLLREEIADTRFALDCWRRKRALEKRFKKAQVDTGKRVQPDDQAYVLVQSILEAERTENIAVNAELRAARAELDKLEREKRAAAPPPAPTPSTPASTRPTPTVRTSTTATTASYYSPSTATTPSATFMPPYRPPYSYTYSQYPTTQYSYNPHAYSTYSPSTTTPYGSTAPQTPAPTTPSIYNPATSAAASSATTPVTSSASAQVLQAQRTAISNTAIPVQLPASSLPALAALGIIPVPSASLPPESQHQPPAVIKSSNGSMLSLEINLSLLQSAQMSGLVLILNALTSRGVNVDGSGGAGSTAAPASQTGASANGTASSTSVSAGPTAASTAAAGTTTVAPSTSTSTGPSTSAPAPAS